MPIDPSMMDPAALQKLWQLGFAPPPGVQLPPMAPAEGAPAGAGAPTPVIPPMPPSVPDMGAPAAPEPGHVPAELDTPAVPPKPNFVSRMLAHLLHVPSAAEGVYSDKDIDAMRRSALLRASAALAGNDQQGFLPGLIGAMSGMNQDFSNQVATGVKTAGMAQEVQNTAALRQADATIAAKYPALKNETPVDTLMRLTHMAADYASMGQPERAKALAEAAKNLKASLSHGGDPTAIRPITLLNGDRTLFDRSRGDTPYLTPGADPLKDESWVSHLHDTGVDTRNKFAQARLDQANQNYLMHMSQYERTLYNKVTDNFIDDPQVKPALVAHNAFESLRSVLDNADNPASVSIITGQLANFADSKARLMLGMMKYLENINPSYPAKFQRYMQEAVQGTLPASQVHDVVKLVHAIAMSTLDGVRQARTRYIKEKAPLFHNGSDFLDQSLPLAEQLFSVGEEPAKAQPAVLPEAPDEEQP